MSSFQSNGLALFIFLVFLLLFSWPFLLMAETNSSASVLGYLLATWMVLIYLLALFAQRIRRIIEK